MADARRVDVATAHGTVAAWRVGTGPAVLLVHGWRDSARLWDPLIAALTERGRSVIALDLPGHGFSGGDRCLAAEVPDAVLAVANALGPVEAAVADSFATTGTALAVAEGLAIERLVLIAPPLAYRTPYDAADGPADGAHQRWRRIADELGFEPAVGDLALDCYVASLGPSRGGWDLSDGLVDLAAAVVVLASVDDERFDIDAARARAAQLPLGALVELAGLDHRTRGASLRRVPEVHAEGPTKGGCARGIGDVQGMARGALDAKGGPARPLDCRIGRRTPACQ